MASIEQLTQSLRSTLADGVRAGVLTQADADRRLRAAGIEPAAEARNVTVSLRVTGNTNNIGGYGAQVNQAVERALAGVAGQAGVTVVPGSVQVRV